MATRRQRSRRHAQRVHHVRAQRARLRAALQTAPPLLNKKAMQEHMWVCGYYPDLKGRWKRRQAEETDALTKPRRGPSFMGIAKARLRKRRK